MATMVETIEQTGIITTIIIITLPLTEQALTSQEKSITQESNIPRRTEKTVQM